MPRLLFSERFAHDLTAVTSERVERHAYECLDHIESFPRMGSPVLPSSIRATFGENVRKLSVRPFDLIYTYDSDADIIYVEALVYQRSA